MFGHNFKYSLKTILKNKGMLFWTIAFPLFMATFFYLAFSNIENSEKLQLIPIAIVDNEGFFHNEVYKKTFEILGDEDNDERVFDITYTSLVEARNMLEEKDVVGYFHYEDEPRIVIKSNGIDETVFEYVVREISEYESITRAALADYYEKAEYIDEEIVKSIPEKINAMMQKDVSLQDISNGHMSYTMIEYYSLIAMTALYSGLLGMYAIKKCLANASAVGKRVALGPSKKSTIITSSLSASFVVAISGLALLFLYTTCVLHVDYGSHYLSVLGLSLLGVLSGISLGLLIAVLIPGREETQTGVLIGVVMLGCFFTGMMGITMKYIIDVYAPIINIVNPANMITDGFYALYYYGVGTRFYKDVYSLIIFIVILNIFSIRYLGRKKYDSL